MTDELIWLSTRNKEIIDEELDAAIIINEEERRLTRDPAILTALTDRWADLLDAKLRISHSPLGQAEKRQLDGVRRGPLSTQDWR